MANQDDNDSTRTNAPGSQEGQAEPSWTGQILPDLSKRPDALRSMLAQLLEQRVADGIPVVLPPKSIHQVVDEIVKAVILDTTTPGQTVYYEPPYDLSSAALVFIQGELNAVFGPGVTINYYQHQKYPDHVIIQFRT